jgi:hypothetical protein
MYVLCGLHSKDKKAESGQSSTDEVQRTKKKTPAGVMNVCLL